MRSIRHYERGATALIIVMFSVLLFITVTVGFMNIMTKEQSRSNDDELSRGAYDSALAGVEDGKRVLAACLAGDTDACDALSADPQKCTTISDAGFASAQANGEVYLKTDTGDTGDFQQAYTCVKISRNTPDYVAALVSDETKIVSLQADSPFTEVALSWHTPPAGNVYTPPTLNGNLTNLSLPAYSNWSGGAAEPTPALLRVQLMQYERGNLKPSDFEDSANASTLYLYPKRDVGSTSLSFSLDGRRSGTLAPSPVRCTTNYAYEGYACRVTLSLPNPVGSDPADPGKNRVAYLRISSLYGPTDYRLQLENSGAPVEFKDVQPAIDATGRAADVFRRVSARVELVDPDQSSLFPRASVDITNNFCKTFSVTNRASDYSPGSCTP